MRKLLTIIALTCLAGTLVFAQEFIDYRSLEKKLAKSNDNIAEPKKAAKLGTWMDRGELMVKIFEAYQGNLMYGMPIANFQLLMGKAQAERDEKIGDVEFHVLETSHVDYYFQDGQYVFFKITKPILDNELALAFEAYKKAIELDPEKKKENKITEALIQLRNCFVNEGLNYTRLTTYAKAANSFQQAIDIDPYATGKKYVMDSTLYYCLAFSQAANNQLQEAFANYEKSVKLGYTMNGELLCQMANVAIQDSTLLPKAYDILKDGITKYPDQKCIILSLIDNSMKQGRDPKEVINYIETAMQSEPDNAVLYAVMGNVYDKLNDVPNAEKYYRRAFELKPDWYDMLYNIAIVYNNDAYRKETQAASIPSRGNEAEYERLMDEAKKELHTCLNILEELDSHKKDHLEALDLMRILYFRFRLEDGMQAKYDAVMQRLESLQK